MPITVKFHPDIHNHYNFRLYLCPLILIFRLGSLKTHYLETQIDDDTVKIDIIPYLVMCIDLSGTGIFPKISLEERGFTRYNVIHVNRCNCGKVCLKEVGMNASEFRCT